MMRVVFVCMLRYRIRGLEHVKTGGGLVLINHQSALDPLLAGVALQRPISYVARDSLFPLPFIGWVLRHTYVMPINREAASSRLIKAMIRRMNHGFLVGMFPEGTRTRDGKVGRFKPGFLAMIKRCDVPIYPVGIAGANDAMPARRFDSSLPPRAGGLWPAVFAGGDQTVFGEWTGRGVCRLGARASHRLPVRRGNLAAVGEERGIEYV